MDHPMSCCRAVGSARAYCVNCDLLVGVEGYHVPPCGAWSRGTGGERGVLARAGRMPGLRGPRDLARTPPAPAGRHPGVRDPVRLVWVKRTWACRELLCPRARITRAFAAHQAHDEVDLTWQCAQQLRSAYKHADKVEGRTIAEQIIDSFPSCPIPEIARLGRTLHTWKDAFLAYFTTGATNGGTEVINGVIELHRRLARDFKNRSNYRLRMLLIGGGLNL
jgi:hypothetical protein